MKLNFFSTVIGLILLLTLTHEVYSQNNSLNGTVTDNSGIPLIGVNVVQKGTTKGTITNYDGEFSLEATPNSTIVFTYIGFAEQEIVWNGISPLNVVLDEDTELLNEIVVIGYGTQKKPQ